MQVFDAREHLVGKHEDSLEAELAVAEIEEVLQTGAQQIYDHHIVVALYAIPADVGDAGCREQKEVG